MSERQVHTGLSAFGAQGHAVHEPGKLEEGAGDGAGGSAALVYAGHGPSHSGQVYELLVTLGTQKCRSKKTSIVRNAIRIHN